MDTDRQPQDSADPELPILVQPVPRAKWPRAITTVRVLTGLQVALVMVCGNCSFGVPLLAAIMWTGTQFSWNEVEEYGVPLAWAVGFAAIVTYAHFTIRWAGRGDRRARTTIVIGTAVLVSFTAVAVAALAAMLPELTLVPAIAAAPSLIIQAVVLRCVYCREGRRWFTSDIEVR